MSDLTPTGGYPCELKRQADAAGVAIESCPLPLTVNPDVKAKVLAALAGDVDGLSELTATALAAQLEIEAIELTKLRKEGFVIDVPIYDADGVEIGMVPRKNPRGELTLKLAENLGHTAAQQGITPKSQGEQRAAEGVAGFLQGLEVMQRRFANPQGDRA